MKVSSTTFLKIELIIIALPVLAICIYGLAWLVKNPVSSDYSSILYPIIIALYMTTVPFFISLFQAFKLLDYIDKKQSFSELSVKSLKIIKLCASSISIIYLLMMPFSYLLAEKDDAPGIIIIAGAFVFGSLVVAAFVAVLQKFLIEVIDIKTNNEKQTD